MNHHALAVDIADLQVCYLSTPQTGSVERHEQSAMEGSASGIDESCDFFLAEDRWKVMVLFRIGSLGDAPGFLDAGALPASFCEVGSWGWPPYDPTTYLNQETAAPLPHAQRPRYKRLRSCRPSVSNPISSQPGAASVRFGS
jgi:hypothetical protein